MATYDLEIEFMDGSVKLYDNVSKLITSAQHGVMVVLTFLINKNDRIHQYTIPMQNVKTIVRILKEEK